MGTIRRVFVDLPFDKGTKGVQPTISVGREASHYLGSVLRVRLNETVELVHRFSGTSALGRIVSLGNDISVQIESSEPHSPPLAVVRTLAIAASKGETIDWVVEKATELAVERLLVWHGERSIPSQESLEKKRMRWGRIAESAALQSGRFFAPPVEITPSLAAAISHIRSTAPSELIYCSLQDGAQRIADLNGISEHRPLSLFIGPEGDFTESELLLLSTEGVIPCSLGALTLRCETAAIAAVSMCNALFGLSPR